MLLHYLKLAIKSIIKQGHQSIISAIGLSVALSCSILILLYVQYEVSYDNFHVNAEHIYRIITKQSAGFSYMGKDVFAVTPAPLKDALVNEIPEIKYSTKCKLNTHTLEYSSSLFTEKGFLYADPDFLKIFTFPVLSGNPLEELKEPFTLFITKEMAVKYFGNEEPVGKTFLVDNKYVFTVRGILENIPQNSHLDFCFLTGFETLYSMRGGKESVEKWGNFSYTTYVQLLDDVKPENISGKLKELSPHYLNPVSILSDQVDSLYISDRKLSTIFIFATVLAVVLTCLGQYSLSSYTTKSRTKEMVIRKVMGSQTSGIMVILTGEMVKWILISIVFAWPIAYYYEVL